MYKFDFTKKIKIDLESEIDHYFEGFIRENQNFINQKILLHYYRLGKIIANIIKDTKDVDKTLKQIAENLMEKYDVSYTKKTLKYCLRFASLFASEEEIEMRLNWPYYVFLFALDDEKQIHSLIRLSVERNLTLYELKNEIKKLK